MNAHELHSEELREEVARLVAESARLREEAKSNELQARVIATRLAEIQKAVALHTVMYGIPAGACVEWQPGASQSLGRASSEPRHVPSNRARALAATA
ncbi:hypothetical protein CfE428DRAFT_2059 [Chthoniobacter flavus Ellin428]|uniref:Uncharacterized protein n=1 Tax=Chthoniobacter flavus Ellin428 TaxID=497964 RepID=B4CZH1_9BACT|nr:hypothetical protein [Chthoniobacter flavus]EDY20135.1 hypothetical protein CfE428DRAFT_2059 [Chthoniobacter flavus Ellin428]